MWQLIRIDTAARIRDCHNAGRVGALNTNSDTIPLGHGCVDVFDAVRDEIDDHFLELLLRSADVGLTFDDGRKLNAFRLRKHRHVFDDRGDENTHVDFLLHTLADRRVSAGESNEIFHHLRHVFGQMGRDFELFIPRVLFEDE